MATIRKHFLVALSVEQHFFESLTLQCHQFEFDQQHENYQSAFAGTQGLAMNAWTKRDYYIDDSDADDVDEISAWDAFTYENALSDWSAFYECFTSIPVSGNGPDSCERAPGVLSCGDLTVELEELLTVEELGQDEVQALLNEVSNLVATSDFESMAKSAIHQTYSRLIGQLQ